ncbi:unnamed protein product [Rhizoctonia solani]|uniref:Zn(2)-C6 fungal-type domain-containing protein n=1 Tax=Rhizoctonia solani TaxID=456999 RepID=A0A8H3DGL9_9AGAM|nr:unnamed protein product [Rhizoctonia solani]
MSCTKFKPGPRRTSCLTCRQRRKKCDLSRPCCQRCLKGGFECLGYEDNELHKQGPTIPILSQSQLVPPAPVEAGSGSLETVTIGSSRFGQDANGIDMNHNPGPSILGAALLYGMNRPTNVSNHDWAVMYSPQDFDCSWPQERNSLATYQCLSTLRSSSTVGPFDESFDTRSPSNYLSRVIEELHRSIPPSVNAVQMIQEGHFLRIVNEYQLQRVSYWFMIPPAPIRDSLIARLKKSKTMIWTMSLGAKLFQALAQEPRSTAVRGYLGWVDKLEQRFTQETHCNPSLDDVADRLLAHLELAYLKFVTVDSISGYAILQKALPGFLRLVAADSSLYMEHPNGNLVVSFPRTLNSPRYELKRFVMYDTAAALVLGLSPLVEYGYDGECDSTSHGLEWIHGVPVVLVQTISQINSWRAGSRVTPLADWKALERSILAWEPQPVVPDGEDSGMQGVARLAVQESWRHVVLIYLYMGLCGVSSHDSRVQASIRQIVQLGETVTNLPIGIHMFTHYVIAGIGARLEKHRALVREKLLSFKDTRVWLFRGPQFSEVLAHLWHGIGAGGAPVIWDDYVRSRCAVVPI